MDNSKNTKKYLKHIVKEVFGKRGLRRLKILSTSSSPFLYSNLYHFHGFYIRFFISDLKNNPEVSILIYNYYFDHTYLKNKGVTSLSIIVKNNAYNKWDYKYIRKDADFKLSDRVLAIPYSKELKNNFYNFAVYVKENLNLGKTHYSGDGYGSDKIEYLFEDDVYVKQGNFRIKLKDLITCSKEKLVQRLNFIRSLGLEDIELFELNNSGISAQ